MATTEIRPLILKRDKRSITFLLALGCMDEQYL